MSIQALILVPDPFFNEPGYERIRNSPDGDVQSRSYNETIREGTVRYAMVSLLAVTNPLQLQWGCSSVYCQLPGTSWAVGSSDARTSSHPRLV